MSGKDGIDERLVISQEKHKVWENRFVEWLAEMHTRIRGQLLTTMEVVFPEGTRLEAIKSRIKDVQNRVWRDIAKAHNRIFKEHFSVTEEKVCETKPDYAFYKKKVEEFNRHLDRVINLNIGQLDRLIENLIVLAEDNKQKQVALKKATKEVTNEIYWAIREWLEGTVHEVFEIE